MTVTLRTRMDHNSLHHLFLQASTPLDVPGQDNMHEGVEGCTGCLDFIVYTYTP